MAKEVMNTFNEIEHKPLRTFNRVVYFSNILSDKGKAYAVKYIENFSELERKEMYLVQMAVKAKGVEAIRKLVTRDAVFIYDPSEDIEYGV